MRFSVLQSDKLRALYQTTTHPSSVQRANVAKETGLELTQARTQHQHHLGSPQHSQVLALRVTKILLPLYSVCPNHSVHLLDAYLYKTSA